MIASADKIERPLEMVPASVAVIDSVSLFTHWNVPLSGDRSVSAGARIERMSADITPHRRRSQ
ncbi:hypothetical protein ACFS4T_16690 [Pseudomonas lini]